MGVGGDRGWTAEGVWRTGCGWFHGWVRGGVGREEGSLKRCVAGNRREVSAQPCGNGVPATDVAHLVWEEWQK